MKFRALLALAFTAPLAGGCTDASIEDELAVDDATAGDDAKADTAGGTYTYYFVEPDLRLCVAPLCGGVFYHLANARSTTCLDGTKQDRCYAASVDWARTGLDDTGMAKVNASVGPLLVRARIGKKDWGGPYGTFAELRPSEAWPAQLAVPADGVLAKIEDTGVKCITFPCPYFREKKLNSSIKAELAELGWDASGATDEQIGDALDQMHGTGLIISGDRYRVSGPGGKGKARTVNQFWLRATNEVCPIIDCAAPPEGCHYEGAVSSPCDQQTCGKLVCDGPL